MKFIIGYQQPESGESFLDIVRDYKNHIEEVYFAWPGTASGRAALGKKRGTIDWTAQEKLEEDIYELRQMGIKIDLLFNSNCYGERAVSISLENEVKSIIEHIDSICGCTDIVTTTSLAIARTVKNNFPDTEVRASVNMKIGTVQGMEHMSGLFDSYYLQRDYQRDISYAKEMKEWCDNHNKKLYILANSGCLLFCPGQTFHDNTVAHDAEIDEMKNIPDWTPHVCWNRYRDSNNYHYVLESSWIRPEDLHNYGEIFPVVKLATRQHTKPRMVIDAYVNQKFNGNLLDLFEPSFSTLFAPYYIDNTKFPEDWFTKTSTCNRKCIS
ncbi:MAG: hypothetical protein ACYTFY_19030, partial [Planctomycetota bacterium]